MVDILFFQLPEFGSEFIKVGVGFPLCMCQRLLNHQELVKLMRNVKVGLV